VAKPRYGLGATPRIALHNLASSITYSEICDVVVVDREMRAVVAERQVRQDIRTVPAHRLGMKAWVA
jgi:hypothetical protein